MNYTEKIQRNSNDILLIPTEEEELFRKKFQDTSTDRKCTMCGNLTKDFQPHPALRVIVCSDCFQFYDNALFLTNKDGSDQNCRWCAKPCSKYCCSCCTVLFCSDCLNRNFSPTYVEENVKNNPEWKCLICNERQLWALRAQCANAFTETDDELDVSKSKETEENKTSTQTESFSDIEDIPETLKNKTLTPEIIKEAREIFEPSKKNFERLIEKIKVNCAGFSSLMEKVEFKCAEDVLELTRRVSFMCKSIQEGVSWIDECNRNAYKKWFNSNISENPVPSKSQEQTQNTSLNNSTPHSLNESIDLLNIFTQKNTNQSQDLKTETDLLNSSQETNINQSYSDDDKKELRKTKTKEKLQSLRLKKAKAESQASGVSENFMNFLDEVKVEISKIDKPQDTKMTANIKTEPIDTNNSVFSIKTMIREAENLSKTASFTQNGINELQDRILTDFDETGTNVELKTVQYLCDKTGDIFDGFEVLNSGCSTPIIPFNDEHRDSSSDTEEINNLTNTKLENATQSDKDFQEEMISYSPGLIKLLNNDFTDNETVDNEDDDVELINEIEQEKELVYKYLVESDCSSYSSITSMSSSCSSFEEDYVMKEEVEENLGYIQTLDIANELHKLRNHLPKSESPTNREFSPAVSPEEEPKFSQKISQECKVRLERVNFDEMDNLEKVPNTRWGYRVLDNQSGQSQSDEDKTSDEDETSDEDKEIDKLLNLKTLDKKKRAASSDSNSDSSTNHSKKARKKKKAFTSQSECNTSNTSDDDDDDDVSIKSDVSSDDILSEYEPTVSKNKNVEDNVFNDLVSSSSESLVSLKDITTESEDSDDDEDLNNKKNKNKKNNSKKGEKSEVPEWKKDVLLTGRLDVTLNGEKNKNNNEVNNKLLEEEEEKFLENDEKSTIKLVKNDDDDDDNAIVLSDTDSSKDSDSDSDDDSDIIFVSNKRKRTEEKENIPLKKGRKNIKKVLDDNELQEETQIADLEEEKRKERISMKNRSLDAVLSQSSLSQEDIGIVLDVDEQNKTPLVKVPQVLVNPLKPHQINGIKFMWDVCFESLNQMKSTAGAGCILAHCMGLGKTMQVVVLTYTLLTHKTTGLQYALIVCPLSTVYNWRNEFEQTLKNAPEKINIFDVIPDRHRTFRHRVFVVKKWRRMGGVLILGYDSFTALVNEKKLNENVTDNYQNIILEALINPGPDLLVCDEGHILKNCKTHKFKALNRVHTKRRIILTGTPLQNNLMEYWHMVSFVKPHLLGTYKEYSNRFVNPIINGQYEDSSPSDIQLMKKRSHVLHKKLQTTVHRYELSELKQYLPNKYEYVLFIQLSELQIKLYELYLEKITGHTTRNLFQNFHDLQNIWTHPALLHHRYEKKKTYDEDFDPNLDPDTVNSQSSLGENWYKDQMPADLSTNLNYGSKMVILFSIIRESCTLGEKVLVFSSSIPELDLIEEFLKSDSQTWMKNSDYYRMDGSVLPEKRMHYCNSFNDEKNKRARLFLISHKVGGLGLNLIAANRVVLMDVNWNPAYDTQSVFRVYRFGQKKPCYIYRLVSLGTMEELVYSRAVTKLAISCRVVDEQQIRRHFKEDDQHKLYKLNTDYLHQEPITPNVPADRLLANLWGKHKPVLYNFKDHQSMLENLPHEELNEEEMKIAWDEFRKEEEVERERVAYQAIIKQQMIVQQNQYQNNPSTSGFIPPVTPQQITRFRPVNRFPMNVRPVVTNTRPLLPTPRPPVTTPRPLATNIRPFLPTSSPLLPTPRPPSDTSPRPIGLISRANDKNSTKPNPLNPYFKNNNQSTEMIVPDIIVNNTPAHSNNLKNLPSTSASVARTVSNLPGKAHNGKKIYGDPKKDVINKQNNSTSDANSVNGAKKMPKLLPVAHNVNIELLAKNGVSISPKIKKNTIVNINDDEIINLE